MAWNGSGTFDRLKNWVSDRKVGIKITASRMDDEFANYKAGLEACLNRNSENAMTADLKMGSKHLVTMAEGSDLTDSLTLGQAQKGAFCYGEDIGAADAYEIAVTPLITTLTAGMAYRVLIKNTNTTTSTLKVGSSTAKTINLYGAVLTGGELVTDSIYLFVYNGDTDVYDVLLTGHNATEATKGVAAIASTADMNTGTNDTKMVTPAKIVGLGIPSWTKYTFGFADFSAAAVTNSITLQSLTAKQVVHAIVIKHTEAFSGGSISSYKVKVGVSGSLSKYATEFDVFQAVADTTGETYQLLKMEDFGGAVNLLITATASHNLDTAAAGSVDVWVFKTTLP